MVLDEVIQFSLFGFRQGINLGLLDQDFDVVLGFLCWPKGEHLFRGEFAETEVYLNVHISNHKASIGIKEGCTGFLPSRQNGTSYGLR